MKTPDGLYEYSVSESSGKYTYNVKALPDGTPYTYTVTVSDGVVSTDNVEAKTLIIANNTSSAWTYNLATDFGSVYLLGTGSWNCQVGVALTTGCFISCGGQVVINVSNACPVTLYADGTTDALLTAYKKLTILNKDAGNPWRFAYATEVGKPVADRITIDKVTGTNANGEYRATSLNMATSTTVEPTHYNDVSAFMKAFPTSHGDYDASNFMSSKIAYVSDGKSTMADTGDGMFLYVGPNSVTEITYPAGAVVKGFVPKAFYGKNVNQITLTIPKTVTTIADNAFTGAYFAGFNFESGGTEDLTIGYRAFYGSSTITSITLPARTAVISDEAFISCSSMTTFGFEESSSYRLTTVGVNAFDYCSRLTSAKFPVEKLTTTTGIISIGSPATRADVVQFIGTPDTVKEGAVTYLRDAAYGFLVYTISGDVGDLVLPEGMKVLTKAAFQNNSTVTSVKIPKSLVTIEQWAFQFSRGVKTLTFAEGSELESIDNYAFTGCPIEKIAFPSKLKFIGQQAFGSNTSLTEVTFSSSVLVLNGATFYGASKLETVVFPETCELTITQGDFTGSAISSVTLPEGTLKIGSNAFNGTKITEIVIPSSVTSIGYGRNTHTFSMNISEISVSGEGGLYSVHDGCLYEGTKLIYVPLDKTEVTIWSGAESMDQYAMQAHSNLYSVVFEEGAKMDIPASAFIGCSSLNTFDASKGVIESIGNSAFSDTYLENVYLSDSVKTLGVKVFYNCTSLKEFILAPTSQLESVGAEAFQGCTVLTKVELPAGMTTFGYQFYGCPSLSVIKFHAPAEGAETYYYDIGQKAYVQVSGGVHTLMLVAANAVPDGDYVSITIPKDVTVFHRQAFQGALSLEKVFIEDGNTSFKTYNDDTVILTADGTKLVYITPLLSELVLPNEVTGDSGLVMNIWENAKALRSLTWGDEDNESNIVLTGFYNSGITDLVVKTKGEVRMGGINFENVYIEAGTLVVQGTSFTNNTMRSSVVLNVGEISLPFSWSYFAGKALMNLDMTCPGFDTTVFHSMFGDNQPYKDMRITLNGEDVDPIQAVTGYKVILNISEIDDAVLVMDTLKRTSADATLTFHIDSTEGYTYDDLECIAGTGGTLTENNGIYTLVFTGDVSVNVSLKSEAGLERHRVTFDAGEGALDASVSESITVAHGRTVVNSEISKRVPVRDGYEFVGWYQDVALTKPIDKTPITEDVTYHAKWRLVDGWTLNFESAEVVTATYPDGRVFVNGEKVENDGKIILTFEPMDGVQLVGWTLNIGGKVKTLDANKSIEITVTSDTLVVPELRYFSTSEGLIGIISTTAPINGDIVTVWKKGHAIDTSMNVWTGVPTIPIIVDNYMFVRSSDDLYKLDINTGEVLKTVTTKGTTSKSYYHALGYGGDVVIDYNTGNAYDLDLNVLYTLPKKFSAAFYSDGFFYGTSSGNVYKMNASNGKLADGVWENGVPSAIFGMYGVSSAPVFIGDWMYFIEVGGEQQEKRIIGGINTKTAETQRIELAAMEDMLLDNGWLTTYNKDGVDYLFLTGYTGGLFDQGSGTAPGKIGCVKLASDGKFSTDEPLYMDLPGTNAASQLVVTEDGWGFVNSDSTLVIFDVDAWISGSDDSRGRVTVPLAYTHGGIVVNTAHASDGKYYVYILPYDASDQRLYVVEFDTESVTATVHKSGIIGAGYGSQAVRTGPNGELIWYNDSGIIYCIKSASDVPYRFLIQDVNGAEWVEVNASDAESALAKALQEFYAGTDVVVDGILVNGLQPSVYIKTNDWVSVDVSGKAVSNVRSFFVSLTVLTDEGSVLDLNEVYETYNLKILDGVREFLLIDLIEYPPMDGRFTRNTYVDITIDVGDADVPEDFTYTYEVETNTPFDPSVITGVSKTGYLLKGWMVDGLLQTGCFTVLSDTVITPVWEWADPNGRVGGVDIDLPYSELLKGDSLDLTATVSPVNVVDGSVVWTSSDPSVATVDQNGRIVAVAVGTVTITVTTMDGGFTDSCIVDVYSIGVDSIVLDRTHVDIVTGSDTVVIATVSPGTANDTSVTWSSDDTSVATVDQNGRVVAVAPGTVIVTVTANDGYGAVARCTVTVSDAPVVGVTSVTFDRSSLTLVEGGSQTLTVNVNPVGAADRTVTWSSDDTSVATVDQNGRVVAVAPGIAVISAAANDGSGAKAVCTVVVEAVEVPEPEPAPDYTPLIGIVVSGVLAALIGAAVAMVLIRRH